MADKRSRANRKVRFGRIHADDVDFPGALARIAQLVDEKRGGFIVTPNVDHVCLAEQRADLVRAYEQAALSLVDGTPLMWLANAMRCPLPAKISGSDLLVPLCQQAAARGDRVYLLGGQEGVGEKAAAALCSQCPGLIIAGIDSPPLGFDQDPTLNNAVLSRIEAARPALVFVALGAPKQELWMANNAAALAPAVALGIGASLDFLAGLVSRAPKWMSKAGLEWTYRLALEPSRMAQRYLVRDRAIVPIALRMLAMPRAEREFYG